MVPVSDINGNELSIPAPAEHFTLVFRFDLVCLPTKFRGYLSTLDLVPVADSNIGP